MSGTTPLFRQWQLLRAISAAGGEATVKSLATAAQTSEKTIRRDLALLRNVGFPIEERSGEFGRKTYAVVDEGAPRLQFAYDEALALYLCRRAATGFRGTFVDEALSNAFRKIEASVGRRAAKYVDTMLARIVPTQVAADYTAQAELLDRLFIAIEESKTTFLTYRSQRATEPATIECYPLRLIEHRGSLYLYGYSRDHGENRTWKVDRMLDAQPTEFQFQRPDDDQITAELAGNFGIFSGHGDVLVRIRFAPSAARYVSEKRMHASQKVAMQPDGSAIAEFRLSNTTEIKAWALSFGPTAEVLEPDSLRTEVIRELAATAGLYSTASQTSRKRVLPK